MQLIKKENIQVIKMSDLEGCKIQVSEIKEDKFKMVYVIKNGCIVIMDIEDGNDYVNVV